MKHKINLKTAVIASAIMLPGYALSQAIGVTVNGEPVVFSGVGPQQVNGRVLVPLRGVLEKLGAYVGWDQATRTVTATKSGTDITLHLGDPHASVNGRDVMLDVPPQEYRGSTMVPLRFVGEALGADVKWNSATYTVNITTSDIGGANQQIDPNQYTPPKNNPPIDNVSISSFDMDRRGTIRGGQELRFTLLGTPGGAATFSIPGVIQDVPMTENQPGVYVGTFRVPANSPINITSASAVARLKFGRGEKMATAGNSLGFDNQPPLITSVTPGANSRVTRPRPNISATLDDGSGSGIDPSTVEIRVDNRTVTEDAQITATSVSYRPKTALENGQHEVTVIAQDRAGNPVTRNWNFRIVSNNDVIRSFAYDTAGQPLSPGTEVTFNLVGEPGGTATFSVGDRVTDRRMVEEQPGKYVGRYTIRRNDNFTNAPVSAKLVTTAGDTFTYEAADRFNADVRSLEAPSFTNLTDGSTVGNTIVLRGTAAPGSRVRIKVDYSKVSLGFFKTTGTISETEVVADDNGRWKTDSIDLATGLGGGSTTYNVTAVTVGANGKTSEVAKLTLHR